MHVTTANAFAVLAAQHCVATRAYTNADSGYYLCHVAPQGSSKTSLLGLASDHGQKHHLILYLLLC